MTVTRTLPRILLTGKNGQVGFELQRALAPLGELVAIDSTHCDFSDEAALRRIVREVAPDIIANPAAYTAVDKAESEPDLAHAINGRAPAQPVARSSLAVSTASAVPSACGATRACSPMPLCALSSQSAAPTSASG